MRVIVLGGTRFIGRRIVEVLAAEGHELLVVHRGESEPDDLPAVDHLHAERADLAQLGAELRSFRPDGLIDTRALTSVDAAQAIAAVDEDVRLLVLSSMDVYRAFGSLLAGRETDPVPIDETSPVRSERYPYRGVMPGFDDYEKLDVEEAYLARGGTVCRLPAVYGEHDYQHREEPILRRVRAQRESIPIGAGSWVWTRGYVGDVATGVMLALASEATIGEVLNLGEPQSWTARLWAQHVLEAAGSDARLVRVPDALVPDDLDETRDQPQHILVDSSKARDLLGWTPADPHDTLRTTVAWHLANPPADASDDFSADDAAFSETTRSVS